MPYADSVVPVRIDSKNKELLCCGSHLRIKIPGVADVRGEYLVLFWPNAAAVVQHVSPEGTREGLPANASMSSSVDANLTGTVPEAGRKAWLCQPRVCPFPPASTHNFQPRGYIKLVIQVF